jgi:hypothetical protein
MRRMTLLETSTMDRFILRFTGQGAMPAADVSRIRAHPDVTVSDTSSRMLLIEATQPAADQLAQQLPDWVCTPERTYPRPDPRPKLRSS